MLPSIWNNDDAKTFFRENGYPYNSYNDGMLAYLRDIYPLTDGAKTLPDLLARYLNDYGDTFNMYIAGKSATRVSAIAPAATFTNTTPTSAAGGADTLLTSAGVHGLTSAVAVGNAIYISAGTGWTVGLHTITAIAVDTTGTTIQIDTPFDANMGTPTIVLANNIITLVSITIPPLRDNSLIELDITWGSTASGNTKTPRIDYGGTLYYGTGYAANAAFVRTQYNIQNQNSLTSQKGCYPRATLTSFGTTTGTPLPTSTVDTSVATTLTLSATPNVANEFVSIENYLCRIIF